MEAIAVHHTCLSRAIGAAELDASQSSVFLGGSIEMGQAEPWQTDVEAALRGTDMTILNPRRDEWDATWAQRIDNPLFRAQVEWELAAQERATLSAFYFAPATKAPVTLLELGQPQQDRCAVWIGKPSRCAGSEASTHSASLSGEPIAIWGRCRPWSTQTPARCLCGRRGGSSTMRRSRSIARSHPAETRSRNARASSRRRASSE